MMAWSPNASPRRSTLTVDWGLSARHTHRHVAAAVSCIKVCCAGSMAQQQHIQHCDIQHVDIQWLIVRHSHRCLLLQAQQSNLHSLTQPAPDLSSSLVCAWWVAPDVDVAAEDHKEVRWSVTNVVNELQHRQQQQKQRCTTTAVDKPMCA